MRTFTVEPSRRTSRPRARARTRARAAGVMRPAATGRPAVREPISRSMSRSRTWLSALAPPQASARPSSISAEPPRRRHAAGPTTMPQAPVTSSRRHDPGLRQRDVVAEARARNTAAPERQRRQHHGRREREAASATCGSVRSDRGREEQGERDHGAGRAGGDGRTAAATTSARSGGSASAASTLCGVPPPSVPLTTASSAAPRRSERRQPQRQARASSVLTPAVPASRARSPCTNPGRNG